MCCLLICTYTFYSTPSAKAKKKYHITLEYLDNSLNVRKIILTNNTYYTNSLKKYKDFYKPAKTIFVNYKDIFFSNFLYKNGKYAHFYDNIEDFSVTNVIVQFSEEDSESGNAFLFYDGNMLEIKWYKKEDNPIKITDSEGNPIFLPEGDTWWCIVNTMDSIVYQ